MQISAPCWYYRVRNTPQWNNQVLLLVLGIILSEGIGNTIRVSLTDEPENEILVAKYILNSLGLKKDMVEIISCPTCGRTKIDIIGLAKAG